MPLADRDMKLAYHKAYYRKNKDKMRAQGKEWRVENRENQLSKQRVYRSNPGKRMRALAAACMWRARENGWDYEPNLLDILELNPPTDCPCCGKVFDYVGTVGNGGKSRGIDNSPSIDRVDSNGGYTLDNIQFLCGQCNRLKSDATLDQLKAVVAFMEKDRQPTQYVMPEPKKKKTEKVYVPQVPRAIVFEGKTLAEWSVIKNEPKTTITARYKAHKTVHRESLPVRNQHIIKYTYEGKTCRQWGEILGISPSLAKYRIQTYGNPFAKIEH